MHIFVKSLLVSGLCLNMACTSSTSAVNGSNISANANAELKISLDRSHCFGTCPSYAVDITGDGLVTYCGVAYVKHRGLKTRQIAPVAVTALYDIIEDADFFNLKDSYRGMVTDNPTYKVTVSIDGRSKTIVDYVGKMDGMPEVVTNIQNAIDATAGTSDWVSRDDIYAPDPPLLKKPDCIGGASHSAAFFGIYEDTE